MFCEHLRGNFSNYTGTNRVDSIRELFDSVLYKGLLINHMIRVLEGGGKQTYHFESQGMMGGWVKEKTTHHSKPNI